MSFFTSHCLMHWSLCQKQSFLVKQNWWWQSASLHLGWGLTLVVSRVVESKTILTLPVFPRSDKDDSWLGISSGRLLGSNSQLWHDPWLWDFGLKPADAVSDVAIDWSSTLQKREVELSWELINSICLQGLCKRKHSSPLPDWIMSIWEVPVVWSSITELI